MQRRNAAIAVVTLSVSAFLMGRGWWKPEQHDDVPEQSEDVHVSESNYTPAVRAITTPAVQPVAATLRVGDDFPYVKTVEQRITQNTPVGDVTSSSLLEVNMGLRVEEIREQNKRLRVRYSHVRYTQDVGGERIVYDSATSPNVAPLAARAYQGLVNNGFDLWLGSDLRPVAIDGFDMFLKRCVRDIPQEERQIFVTALVGMSQDDGIASFIDESIGLLPYICGSNADAATMRVGAKWEQQRHIDRPIALDLTNACTLKSIDEYYATVEIAGEIHPALDMNAAAGGQNGVVLRGGRAVGECVIDRRTGMPLESRMDRTLEMTVPLRDGSSIDQQKYVQTTIHALPSESPQHAVPRAAMLSTPAVPPPPPADGVVPASYERADVPPAANP